MIAVESIQTAFGQIKARLFARTHIAAFAFAATGKFIRRVLRYWRRTARRCTSGDIATFLGESHAVTKLPRRNRLRVRPQSDFRLFSLLFDCEQCVIPGVLPINPSETKPDLFFVDVHLIDENTAKNSIVPIGALVVHRDLFTKHKIGQALFRTLAERLRLLGGIYLRETDFNLPLVWG